MSISAALTPVVEELERLGVVHQIGGSVASSAHGAPRSTMDVDLVADLREEHVAPLCAALRGAYYAEPELVRDAVRQRSCTNFLHLATAFKVDVFVPKDTPYDRAALQRSVQRPITGEEGGRTFPMATAEDVLLRKMLWFRAGDEVSDRQWHDIVGVLRAQVDRLDHVYLYQWARELKVDDLLARAEQEVAPD